MPIGIRFVPIDPENGSYRGACGPAWGSKADPVEAQFLLGIVYFGIRYTRIGQAAGENERAEEGERKRRKVKESEEKWRKVEESERK